MVKGRKEMTGAMKKMLATAATDMGAPDSIRGKQIFEARGKGWVVSAGRRQNSTTTRYKITSAGRAALASESACT